MDAAYNIKYTLRVSCITEATAPCPRPTPWKEECSGQGTCGMPPQGVARPALNRVCTCDAGLGDYGCQTPVPLLGDGGVASAVLDPGAWAFWQLRVPLPPQGVKPALLVELSRSSVGFGPALGGFGTNSSTTITQYGGDPVLVLMPKDADGSNRLPWFNDTLAYADLRSYFLQQNLHYVLTRDLTAAVNASGGTAAEYYVAVFNNDQRFSGNPTLHRGGTLCEGRLRNMTVSTSGEGSNGILAPGQWTFFVLSFDPRRFDYRTDVLAIQWVVNDGTADSPTAFANAYLTIDENAFPRNAQLDSDDPFRRGWQIFYSSLVLRSNPPQPLQMKGSDLKPGYNYVLGVYNSDYVRKMSFEYGLSVYVPSTSRTWLHPYMSVVLGVTASIILCLFMTLCRRLVQRYGWGPFRPRDPIQGNMTRIQVTQMAPRQQGVPSHILESLHTYQYTASKAEKEQLARSRRDHEQAQLQQQASLPRQASLRTQGSNPQPAATADHPPHGAEGHRCSESGCKSESTVVNPSIAAMAAAAAAPDPVLHAAGPIAATGAGTSAATDAAAPVNKIVDEDDEPQCTVCLCEYEEGERITQLPCKHEFHATCINK
ncbi:hypothetical protein GPECTOR_29g25 [Gonium pectorale]|uniref:RING-type E3 ubiquitin transferase n=1 Tax=Gonium pectorale TaxID=33097 RepID=A0A150GF93_GONPE|nr:hypothetical protein GPECTOR_29g25 [Gonium pectorale]|eukprot:KXZ48245.1 hypothetical protein GPECTOR_29g25 [Gonium pectorale]